MSPSPRHPGERLAAGRDAGALKRVAAAILRDESQADDILQEVWLLTRTCKPSDYQDAPSWLVGVVKNLARNARRAQARRQRREHGAARGEALESTLEIASRESVVAFLRRAVSELPEVERAAVELRYFEELEVQEVAARLDRPVGTVKHQLRRGLEGLRARLSGEFGEARAWSLGLIGAFDWSEQEVRAALGGTGAATTGGAAGAWGAWTWLGAAGATALVALGAIMALGPWPARDGPSAPPALARAPGDARPIDAQPGDGTEAAVAGVAAPGRSTPSAPDEAGAAHPASSASGEAAAEAESSAPAARTLGLAVVDAAGVAIAGAEVLIADASNARFQPALDTRGAAARTGSDGRCTLALGADTVQADRGFGEHVTVLVTAAGFAHSDFVTVVLDPEGASGATAGASANVTVALTDGEVVVEGRALDAHGAPLDRGVVGLMPLHPPSKGWEAGVLRMRSDQATQELAADGRYRLDRVRPGTYDLFVWHPNTGMDRERVELDRAGLVARDIVQRSGAILRGRAVDESGRPLAAARVHVRFSVDGTEFQAPPVPATLSADDGSFALPCLANAPIWVHAQSSEEPIRTAERRWFLQGSEAPELVLVLRTPNVRDVEVRTPDGRRVPGLRVSALVETPAGVHVLASEGITDEEGRVSLDLGSTAGRLRIAVRDLEASFALPEQVTEVEAGVETGVEAGGEAGSEGPIRVVYDPRAPGRIAGVVAAAGWRLPANVRLEVARADCGMFASFALAPDDGAFVVEAIPPGPYALYLRAGDALGRALGTIVLEPGAELDTGALSLPIPGSVYFDPRTVEPGDPPSQLAAAARFEVATRQDWVLWSASALPEAPLELLPGDYVLRIDRTDGSRTQVPFTVVSGEEAWVIVDL